MSTKKNKPATAQSAESQVTAEAQDITNMSTADAEAKVKADAEAKANQSPETKLKLAAKEALSYFPKETDCYVTDDGNVFLNREKASARFHAQRTKQSFYLFTKATENLEKQ